MQAFLTPAATALLLWTLACTSQDRPAGAGTAVERDRSGVRIVANSPPDASLPRLVLSEEADLAIETQDNDTSVTLYRVTQARSLSNGGFFVASGHDLLWFDSGGRLVARNGGRGGGPSEFKIGIAHIALLAGDTILGLSLWPAAMKLFGPNGEYVRSLTVPRLPAQIRRLADGSWVGLAFAGEFPPETPGLFREQWAVLRYNPDLSTADTLARIAGRALYGDRVRSTYVPAGPRAFVNAWGDRFATGSSDRYEINLYDGMGGLTHVIRNSMPAPAVPSGFQEERPRRVLPLEPGSPARLRTAPTPQSGPAFDALLFAHDSALWVRRWTAGSPVREWHIYDSGGRLSAVALLPANFRPTEITDSTILGIWRDEFDVESVRRYRLIQTNQGTGPG